MGQISPAKKIHTATRRDRLGSVGGADWHGVPPVKAEVFADSGDEQTRRHQAKRL